MTDADSTYWYYDYIEPKPPPRPAPRTFGWREIHRYLRSSGIAAADPLHVQAEGGTYAGHSLPACHPRRSHHYPCDCDGDGVARGHAVDYGANDGISDLAAIWDALEPLARSGVIRQLIWDPRGGWFDGSLGAGDGNHWDHLHASIRCAAHLPESAGG
jgi:hypothetical protein